MGRQRDPKRNEAFEIYQSSNGEINLVDIASRLGVSAGTVRGWKAKDNWEDRLNSSPALNSKKRNAKANMERSKNTERSKKKQSVPERRKPPPISEPEYEPPDMPDESGLTTKQRMFILEYLRDFNATRAAIAAGYSKKTAHVTGWDNLRNPKIKQEIDKVKDDLVDSLGLSVQRIIMEYMKIAFADISDYVTFGQKEVPVMGMFGPVQDEDGNPMMQDVNYVEFKESDEIDGTVVSQVKMGKDGASIKLYDKLAALKQLEKYTTFLTETQKIQLEKARLEVAKLRGDDLTDEDSDDGFMEALGGIAAEVWPDED
ncbi:terminase small subunit [Paenibacillus hunanensis]|uniref:Phage terminase small subunit n=1 Tax=Paenibacillus hunanensis TaxID=539262 RepID=A0ABU1IV88_9BACL|nr:terminase small subunit [Paenibacillus hunanensis]MDR6243160.1 phage terminase small subunit [Paenibacillus hunanensis]GGJ11353.1 PBSX phage terminase small subunit [Paenibacillus hunanensis]